ncbi:MAG: MFS transporter [Chthoniobacterales bacterium]
MSSANNNSDSEPALSPNYQEAAADSSLPRSLWNCHLFQLFNAVGFQIFLGAPIVLYAKYLGATSTELGILASFVPIMTILQLPTAYYLHHFSYRKFITTGWGIRALFVSFLALVPFMEFLDSEQKLFAVMVLIFIISVIRGVSSTAFMPWTTEIVPADHRGKFLSRDMMFVHLGSLASLLIVAFVLKHSMNGLEYSAIFFISALAGTICLLFILRIPDASPGEAHSRSLQSVPWKTIINYPPFRILLIFNVIYTLVIGSLGVFSIEYLREVPKFSPDSIILLSAFSFIGALLSLPFTGSIIDRVGSKPVFRVTTFLLSLVIIGWFLLATEIIPPIPSVVACLIFFFGVSSANFNVANSRLMMGTIPELGRSHFFALYMVIAGLGLGVSPIVWGILLDTLEVYELHISIFSFKRHGFYFAAILLISTLLQFFLKYLHEAKAKSLTAEAMTIYGNLKRLGRIGIGR